MLLLFGLRVWNLLTLWLLMCPSFRSVDPMRWVTINFTRQRDLLFAADIDNLLGAIIFCNFFGFNPLNTILATFFNYKYYYLVSYSCLYVVIMQVTTPKAQTICCCHCHRTSEPWNFQSAFQILGGFHISFWCIKLNSNFVGKIFLPLHV